MAEDRRRPWERVKKGAGYGLGFLGIVVGAATIVGVFFAFFAVAMPNQFDQFRINVGLAAPSNTPYPTQTPYPTYTRYPTFTLRPFPTPSSTRALIVPTPLPLGGAIVGALANDGSAYPNTRVTLYPKTLVDAAGELHGDRTQGISVPADAQTALASFSDLEPGVYIVCFTQPRASATVGELVIEPYAVVRQNFRWPTSLEIGSGCEL